MILRQWLHTEPVVAASYLGGCGGRAAGAVIDPVALSGTPFSSIGFERRFNPAFRLANREAFVALMARDVPPRPPRAGETRAHNLGQPAGAVAPA